MADLAGLRQRVEQIMLDNDLRLQVTKSALMVPFHTTTVAVTVMEMGEHSVVQMRGLVAQNVPISDALKCHVAERSAEWIFGHPTYQEIEGKAFVEFRYSLLGDFLDPDEVMVAVRAVVGASDELSDQIHERFGGERWIDPPQQG